LKDQGVVMIFIKLAVHFDHVLCLGGIE